MILSSGYCLYYVMRSHPVKPYKHNKCTHRLLSSDDICFKCGGIILVTEQDNLRYFGISVKLYNYQKKIKNIKKSIYIFLIYYRNYKSLHDNFIVRQ